MKFLFDLFPVILFFLVYKFADGHQDAAHALVQQYMGGLISGGAPFNPSPPESIASGEEQI